MIINSTKFYKKGLIEANFKLYNRNRIMIFKAGMILILKYSIIVLIDLSWLGASKR